MAGNALLGCALENIVYVALGAFYVGMRTGQLEGCLGMVEAGFFPVVRCVTAATIGAELALVGVVLGVAGCAILWRTFEDIVDVAFFAGHIRMRAGQLKSRFGVVEGGFLPILGRMAACAIHVRTFLGVHPLWRDSRYSPVWQIGNLPARGTPLWQVAQSTEICLPASLKGNWL